MARLVVIGPDVWLAYLREEDGPASERVDDLIGAGTARCTEAAGAEAIRRCESMEQAAAMRETLVDLPPLEEGRASWVRAGELAWRMRHEGGGTREIGLLDAHTALAAHKVKADVLTGEEGLAAASTYLGLRVLEP